MNRQSLKQFIRAKHGSVSVYLIVILVPIFLFHAVLIDYARVMLAQRESEMAVKTGLRSVLAGFDLDLQPYDLFALKTEPSEANSFFGEMIQENITPSTPGKYLQLLDEKLIQNSPTLHSVYTLANQAVFDQQILEDMKYIAPLQQTLEIVNKFKKTDISDQLKSSKQFFEHSDRLENLLEQRYQALEHAWTVAQQFLDQAEEVDFEFDNKSIANQLKANYSSLSQNYQTINSELVQAEDLNERINQEKQQEFATFSSQPVSNSFNFIKNYDVNYFSYYRTELSKTLAIYSGMQTQLDNVVNNSALLKDFLSQSGTALFNQTSSFRHLQGALEADREQAYQAAASKKNEQRNKLDHSLSSAKRDNQGCNLSADDRYKDSYQTLNGDAGASHIKEGLYAKYQSYNRNNDEIASNESKFTFETQDSSIQSSLKWIETFTSQVAAVRDDLYVTEYVLNKFNYRTLPINEESSHRSLQNQEIEYVLYGSGSCSANYTAAYAEMFIMLLSIRTMEALIKPQNEMMQAGSPLLVFLAAAAQGAAAAYEDMTKLLNGKAVPILNKSPKLTVDYKQLLRIFLMLHYNEDRFMSRMQALIELETQTPLEQKSTYIQGSAHISIRLWFMSAIFKSLQFIGVSPCKIVNNRCEIIKTAVMAY